MELTTFEQAKQNPAGPAGPVWPEPVDVAGLGLAELRDRLGLIKTAESRIAAMKAVTLAAYSKLGGEGHARQVVLEDLQASPQQANRLDCATLKHMEEVGIRALKQNASAVVAKAAAGEIVTITSRGQPVALMTPIPKSRLQELVDAGLTTEATRDIADLPDPIVGPQMSPVLSEMRESERY